MTADVFQRMLADACDEKQGTTFFFGDGYATLLLSAGSTFFSIEKVQEVHIKDGYATAQTSRREQYLIDPAAVVGLRIGMSKSDAAGFKR